VLAKVRRSISNDYKFPKQTAEICESHNLQGIFCLKLIFVKLFYLWWYFVWLDAERVVNNQWKTMWEFQWHPDEWRESYDWGFNYWIFLGFHKLEYKNGFFGGTFVELPLKLRWCYEGCIEVINLWCLAYSRGDVYYFVKRIKKFQFFMDNPWKFHNNFEYFAKKIKNFHKFFKRSHHNTPAPPPKILSTRTNSQQITKYR